MSIALPLVHGWPYKEISESLAEFAYHHPSHLLVGYGLWSLLTSVCDAEIFFSEGAVRVYLDTTGVLEPHEFMFFR